MLKLIGSGCAALTHVAPHCLRLPVLRRRLDPSLLEALHRQHRDPHYSDSAYPPPSPLARMCFVPCFHVQVSLQEAFVLCIRPAVVSVLRTYEGVLLGESIASLGTGRVVGGETGGRGAFSCHYVRPRPFCYAHCENDPTLIPSD